MHGHVVLEVLLHRCMTACYAVSPHCPGPVLEYHGPYLIKHNQFWKQTFHASVRAHIDTNMHVYNYMLSLLAKPVVDI